MNIPCLKSTSSNRNPSGQTGLLASETFCHKVAHPHPAQSLHNQSSHNSELSNYPNYLSPYSSYIKDNFPHLYCNKCDNISTTTDPCNCKSNIAPWTGVHKPITDKKYSTAQCNCKTCNTHRYQHDNPHFYNQLIATHLPSSMPQLIKQPFNNPVYADLNNKLNQISNNVVDQLSDCLRKSNIGNDQKLMLAETDEQIHKVFKKIRNMIKNGAFVRKQINGNNGSYTNTDDHRYTKLACLVLVIIVILNLYQINTAAMTVYESPYPIASSVPDSVTSNRAFDYSGPGTATGCNLIDTQFMSTSTLASNRIVIDMMVVGNAGISYTGGTARADCMAVYIYPTGGLAPSYSGDCSTSNSGRGYSMGTKFVVPTFVATIGLYYTSAHFDFTSSLLTPSTSYTIGYIWCTPGTWSAHTWYQASTSHSKFPESTWVYNSDSGTMTVDSVTSGNVAITSAPTLSVLALNPVLAGTTIPTDIEKINGTFLAEAAIAGSLPVSNAHTIINGTKYVQTLSTSQERDVLIPDTNILEHIKFGDTMSTCPCDSTAVRAPLDLGRCRNAVAYTGTTVTSTNLCMNISDAAVSEIVAPGILTPIDYIVYFDTFGWTGQAIIYCCFMSNGQICSSLLGTPVATIVMAAGDSHIEATVPSFFPGGFTADSIFSCSFTSPTPQDHAYVESAIAVQRRKSFNQGTSFISNTSLNVTASFNATLDGNVRVINTPTVHLDATQLPLPVTYLTPPTVTLSGTPGVSVSNAPHITIDGAPISVKFDTPQHVTMDGVVFNGTVSVGDMEFGPSYKGLPSGYLWPKGLTELSVKKEEDVGYSAYLKNIWNKLMHSKNGNSRHSTQKWMRVVREEEEEKYEDALISESESEQPQTLIEPRQVQQSLAMLQSMLKKEKYSPGISYTILSLLTDVEGLSHCETVKRSVDKAVQQPIECEELIVCVEHDCEVEHGIHSLKSKQNVDNNNNNSSNNRQQNTVASERIKHLHNYRNMYNRLSSAITTPETLVHYILKNNLNTIKAMTLVKHFKHIAAKAPANSVYSILLNSIRGSKYQPRSETLDNSDLLLACMLYAKEIHQKPIEVPACLFKNLKTQDDSELNLHVEQNFIAPGHDNLASPYSLRFIHKKDVKPFEKLLVGIELNPGPFSCVVFMLIFNIVDGYSAYLQATSNQRAHSLTGNTSIETSSRSKLLANTNTEASSSKKIMESNGKNFRSEVGSDPNIGTMVSELLGMVPIWSANSANSQMLTALKYNVIRVTGGQPIVGLETAPPPECLTTPRSYYPDVIGDPVPSNFPLAWYVMGEKVLPLRAFETGAIYQDACQVMNGLRLRPNTLGPKQYRVEDHLAFGTAFATVGSVTQNGQVVPPAKLTSTGGGDSMITIGLKTGLSALSQAFARQSSMLPLIALANNTDSHSAKAQQATFLPNSGYYNNNLALHNESCGGNDSYFPFAANARSPPGMAIGKGIWRAATTTACFDQNELGKSLPVSAAMVNICSGNPSLTVAAALKIVAPHPISPYGVGIAQFATDTTHQANVMHVVNSSLVYVPGFLDIIVIMQQNASVGVARNQGEANQNASFKLKFGRATANYIAGDDILFEWPGNPAPNVYSIADFIYSWLPFITPEMEIRLAEHMCESVGRSADFASGIAAAYYLANRYKPLVASAIGGNPLSLSNLTDLQEETFMATFTRPVYATADYPMAQPDQQHCMIPMYTLIWFTNAYIQNIVPTPAAGSTSLTSALLLNESLLASMLLSRCLAAANQMYFVSEQKGASTHTAVLNPPGQLVANAWNEYSIPGTYTSNMPNRQKWREAKQKMWSSYSNSKGSVAAGQTMILKYMGTMCGVTIPKDSYGLTILHYQTYPNVYCIAPDPAGTDESLGLYPGITGTINERIASSSFYIPVLLEDTSLYSVAKLLPFALQGWGSAFDKDNFGIVASGSESLVRTVLGERFISIPSLDIKGNELAVNVDTKLPDEVYWAYRFLRGTNEVGQSMGWLDTNTNSSQVPRQLLTVNGVETLLVSRRRVLVDMYTPASPTVNYWNCCSLVHPHSDITNTKLFPYSLGSISSAAMTQWLSGITTLVASVVTYHKTVKPVIPVISGEETKIDYDFGDEDDSKEENSSSAQSSGGGSESATIPAPAAGAKNGASPSTTAVLGEATA